MANGKGRLTWVNNSVSTSRYTAYDEAGRVKNSEQQLSGGTAYPFSYEYNLAGGLTKITLPSGRQVKTEYDGAGRISAVKNAVTQQAYATPTAFWPHQAVKNMALGNSLWEYAAYNNRLQPETMGLGVSSGDLSKLALGFTYGLYANNNGNVQTQTIAFNGWQATQTYGYDPLNRLNSASEVQNAGGTNWYQYFGYDRWGNQWQSSTNVPTNALVPTAEGAINQANNRLAGMTYDDVGNQTDFSNTWHFTYDAENRQATARITVSPGTQTTYTYAYDGDGRRVKRNVPGHADVYVYDAFGTLAAEYQDGVWLKDFVYMGGKLLMVDDAKQGTSYLTTDHLGSTRLVTNASGGVISRHDYLPFGKEVPLDFGLRRQWGGYETTGPAEHVLQRFTGKELDPETGLDYFGARYYSGRQGRFMSPDPGAYKLEDPQTFNRYAYVNNNPLKYIDPTGREAQYVIDQKSRTIKIRTSITIYGPRATTAYAAKLKAVIEGAWKGKYTDPTTGIVYGVSTTVDVTVYNPILGSGLSARNGFYVGDVGRSSFQNRQTDARFPSRFPGDPGIYTGTLNPAADVERHEGGHVLGQPDDYWEDPIRGTSGPQPGHAGHLMADPHARMAAQDEIDRIGSFALTQMRTTHKSQGTIIRLPEPQRPR